MPTTEQFDNIRKMDRTQIKAHILLLLKCRHFGHDCLINKWDMVQDIFGSDATQDRTYNNTNERRMRLAIAELRKAGYPICSDSAGGYWYAGTLDEVLAAAGELEARAKDLFETAEAMKQKARLEFGPQMKLI